MLLLLLGGGAFWYYQRASETAAVAAQAPPAAAAVTDLRSIAVLPFADMSAGKDQEYFADGLSEELLNLLAKLPELRVIGRTSSFQFKGRNEDLRVIGQKLNVAHILEGSVRKSGNKVRITAQLIKAADGYHLWSETYDRTLDDIFVVQDDIAGEVVKALKVTLLGTALTTRSKPQDSEAYNLALQGRFFSSGAARRTSSVQSITSGSRGSAIPSTPRPGRACRRHTRGRPTTVSCRPPTAIDGRARPRRRRWRSIPSSLTRIWRWAGFSKSTTGTGRPRTPAIAKHWTWNPATPWPSGASALQALILGRWNEAIDLTNKAIERDPLRPASYSNLGLALLAVNRDTEAEAAFRKALELDPDGAFGIWRSGGPCSCRARPTPPCRRCSRKRTRVWRLSGLPLVFHALGRRSESDAALAALKSKYGGEMAYQIAEVHAFRGEADLAFEWLERAYDQRDAGVSEIKGDRLMRGIVGDPRYKAFLRKLKLPE